MPTSALQPWEDDSGAVQRERDVRRRVLKIFNATADDFATSAAHDDYLETIEEIVANLVAGTDVPATNARLAAHRAANEASIGAAADAAADAAAKAARDRAAREALEAMEEVDGPAARRRRAAAAKREKGERRRAERERAAKAAATGAVKVNRFLTPGVGAGGGGAAAWGGTPGMTPGMLMGGGVTPGMAGGLMGGGGGVTPAARGGAAATPSARAGAAGGGASKAGSGKADVHARARAGGWDKRVVRQRAWQELTDTLSGG